jgi:hypothetical protein
LKSRRPTGTLTLPLDEGCYSAQEPVSRTDGTSSLKNGSFIMQFIKSCLSEWVKIWG